MRAFKPCQVNLMKFSWGENDELLTGVDDGVMIYKITLNTSNLKSFIVLKIKQKVLPVFQI